MAKVQKRQRADENFDVFVNGEKRLIDLNEVQASMVEGQLKAMAQYPKAIDGYIQTLWQSIPYSKPN